MIVTLAVYSRDAAKALRLLEWITELGGVKYHTLVIGSTPQVNPIPLIVEGRKAFGAVEQFVIKTNNEVQKWPAGNNNNFLAVCEYMDPKNRPFFFMESDVVPLRMSWLDDLEREYLSNGKPFMGEVHPMVDAKREIIAGSEHMNGSGIYPASVKKYLPTLPFINGAIAKQPWDVALRFEVLYLVNGQGGFRIGPDRQRVSACHATEAICFCWRSLKYREENGRIGYDLMGWAHARDIDFRRHVVHHGCKDDSLIHLLRARLRAARGQARPVAPASANKVEEPPPVPAAPPKPPATAAPQENTAPVPPSEPLPPEEVKIQRTMEILGVDRENAIAFIDAAAKTKDRTVEQQPAPPPSRLPAAAFKPRPKLTQVARKRRGPGKPKAKPAAAPAGAAP